MRNIRPFPVPQAPPAGAAFGLALGQGLVGAGNNFVQGYQAAKQARMRQAMEAARMQWEREKFDAEQAGKIGVASIGAGATLGAAKIAAGSAANRLELDAKAQALREFEAAAREFEDWRAPYMKVEGFNVDQRLAEMGLQKDMLSHDPAVRAAAREKAAAISGEYAKYVKTTKDAEDAAKLRRAGVRAQTDLDIRDERDAMNRIDETIGGFVRDKGLVNFDLAGVRDAFQRAGGQIRTAALGWVRGRREPNFDDQGKIIRAVHEMLIGNAVGLKLRQQPNTSEEELNALREALRNDPAEQLRAKSIALDGILPRLLTLPAR